MVTAWWTWRTEGLQLFKAQRANRRRERRRVLGKGSEPFPLTRESGSPDRLKDFHFPLFSTYTTAYISASTLLFWITDTTIKFRRHIDDIICGKIAPLFEPNMVNRFLSCQRATPCTWTLQVGAPSLLSRYYNAIWLRYDRLWSDYDVYYSLYHNCDWLRRLRRKIDVFIFCSRRIASNGAGTRDTS